MATLSQIQYHKSNGASIVEYTYNSGILYEEGDFKYVKRESQLSSSYTPPSKNPIPQNILKLSDKDLKIESILKKVIPEKDGRKLVDNSNEYPYSIHAQLEMDFPDGSFGGSGSMVGPNHLLTCAHNVYSNKHWANSIQIYPAKNKTIAPFGTAKVTKAYVYEDWTKSGDRNFDIALLTLDRSIGELTGWGGISCIKDSYLKETTIHITGYPGDKGFNQMYTMDHKIQNVSSETFEYTIDTFGGQSGSAIWLNNFEHQPSILGVHTLGGKSANYGVRISQNKFLDLVAPFISRTYKNPTNRITLDAKIELDNPKFSLPLVIHNKTRHELRNFTISHKSNRTGINTKGFRKQKPNIAKVDIFYSKTLSNPIMWSFIDEKDRPNRIFTTIQWIIPIQWFDGGPGYGKDYWRISFNVEDMLYQTSKERDPSDLFANIESECWFADIFSEDKTKGVTISIEEHSPESPSEDRFWVEIKKRIPTGKF